MSSFKCRCRCIKNCDRDRECDHEEEKEWIRQAIKEAYWRGFKTDAENAAGETEIVKILKNAKNSH
jgi:hypothetical protein